MSCLVCQFKWKIIKFCLPFKSAHFIYKDCSILNSNIAIEFKLFLEMFWRSFKCRSYVVPNKIGRCVWMVWMVVSYSFVKRQFWPV